MKRDNRAYNFEGNYEDEHGNSHYVIDAEGEILAGPFGSESYAYTVEERLESQWHCPVRTTTFVTGPLSG